MTRDDMWRIFKNTGSVEAYITFAQACVCSREKDDGKQHDKNNRNNIENKRHTK